MRKLVRSSTETISFVFKLCCLEMVIDEGEDSRVADDDLGDEVGVVGGFEAEKLQFWLSKFCLPRVASSSADDTGDKCGRDAEASVRVQNLVLVGVCSGVGSVRTRVSEATALVVLSIFDGRESVVTLVIIWLIIPVLRRTICHLRRLNKTQSLQSKVKRM